MTKYDELCRAYGVAKANYQQYLADAEGFANFFKKALVAYFGVPKKLFSLHYIDEFGEIEKVKMPISNAMLLRNDAFFQLGIGISLCEATEPDTQETFILPIHLAIDVEGVHKIRMGDYGALHIIDLKSKTPFDDFLDEVFESVKQSYEKGLTEIRSKNAVRRIGFV
jgi:hypothetical protein